MATVTTSTISLPLNAYYIRKMLEAAQPYDVHGKYLQMVDLPAGSGTQTVKWRRYENMTTATTSLTEGVTPPSASISITDITATTAQYGSWLPFTDQVKLLNVEPVVQKMGQKLGQQAGHSVDETRRDVLIAGTNVAYANGSATTDVNTALSATMLKKAIRALKRTNTDMITSKITGTDKVGTQPIRAGFIGIVHPDTTQTLEGIAGYVPAIEYPQGDAMENEVGAYREIRFIESTNAAVSRDGGGATSTMISQSDTNADVYKTLIFGADFAGGVALAGHALEKFIKPVGSAGAADPLNQRGSIGWKGQWVTKILNDDFGIRLEHANLENPA
jgi:N4-gp56 family major capsid protein